MRTTAVVAVIAAYAVGFYIAPVVTGVVLAVDALATAYVAKRIRG